MTSQSTTLALTEMFPYHRKKNACTHTLTKEVEKALWMQKEFITHAKGDTMCFHSNFSQLVLISSSI